MVTSMESISQLMHHLFIPVFNFRHVGSFIGLESTVFSFCPFHNFLRISLHSKRMRALTSTGLLRYLQLPLG